MQWIRADIFPSADPAVLHLYQQTLTHFPTKSSHGSDLMCTCV